MIYMKSKFILLCFMFLVSSYQKEPLNDIENINKQLTIYQHDILLDDFQIQLLKQEFESNNKAIHTLTNQCRQGLNGMQLIVKNNKYYE